MPACTSPPPGLCMWLGAALPARTVYHCDSRKQWHRRPQSSSTHGWAVPSLLDATPPPSRSGPKAPRGGGGGGGGLFGGGGLAAEEGFSKGLASRC